MTSTPPPLPTIRRIKHVAPLQLGKMLALLYGMMGVIACPFFFMAAFVSSRMQMHGPGATIFGTGFVLLLPFLYAAFGFIGGIISAFIYNVIAKWIGGIQVEVE